MTISEIKTLPVSERMNLMEEIWDSLCHEAELPESPAWHREILDERVQRVSSGQAKFLTLRELKDRNR